jgi:hypothetical protein
MLGPEEKRIKVFCDLLPSAESLFGGGLQAFCHSAIPVLKNLNVKKVLEHAARGTSRL